MNIPLWQELSMETDEPNKGCPSLTPFLLEGEGPFPTVIVCPGGGYRRRAFHEGEPVARWLNSIGIAAFVLHYRVAPHAHPVQLDDAQRAIRLVRHKASEWNLDISRIGIMGFSAGGHLTAMAGTLFDYGKPDAEDPIDRESSRPDLMILCYPVISMGTYAHEGSRSVLLGEHLSDKDLMEQLSAEKQITENTPPAFLWHTVNDSSVPVENSMLFANGLRKQHIPFAMHLFEDGAHGLGLASDHEEAGKWPVLCESWLKQRKFL